MNIEKFREYCLMKKGVEECTPFGPDTLVYKVMGKMFALANLNGDLSINLKCDPEIAIELREKFPCVQPGYHMNKTHWNSVFVDGSVSDKLIMEWVDNSYELVVASLTKEKKKILKQI